MEEMVVGMALFQKNEVQISYDIEAKFNNDLRPGVIIPCRG
jgi:hypothetical protein